MIANRQRDTQAAIERVRNWLSTELRTHARDELVSAVMRVLIALGAAALICLALMLLIGREFLRLGESGALIAVLIAPALLLIALIAQGFRHRSNHGVMQVQGRKIHFVDSKTHLSDPGGGDALANILLFPAWLVFSAFESLANAWRLRQADAEFCARLLAYLASEDRRVFIPDLENTFSERLAPNLQAMVVFPGVIVASRETPSLLLSAELGAQVRDML